MNLHWADNPPLHKMVAAYLGVEPLSSGGDQADAIDSASEFIPVETLSKPAFDDLLRQHGLPTGE